MIRFLTISLLALLLSSCASYFVRQECNKLNWYQVGFDAAMRGERISNDDRVGKCRKAEAEISEQQLDTGWKAGMSRYCQPDGVFQTGKNGDLFNTDFCEQGQLSMLRKRHADGLYAYCQDGMAAGLSGKKYKNVCAANLEAKFLPKYQEGRKKYLNGMLANAETKRRDVAADLDKLQYEKRIIDSRMSLLPVAKAGDSDPYSSERSRLSDQSWRLGGDISQKNGMKNELDKEIDEYRKELATLN